MPSKGKAEERARKRWKMEQKTPTVIPVDEALRLLHAMDIYSSFLTSHLTLGETMSWVRWKQMVEDKLLLKQERMVYPKKEDQDTKGFRAVKLVIDEPKKET